MLLPDEVLYDWVHRVTGLDTARSAEARRAVAELGPHVIRELAERQDIDAVVGAVGLYESIEKLVAAGVPRTKLHAKLRADPDVWPTWAEIRVAASILEAWDQVPHIEFEPGRSHGRHADFHVSFEGDERLAVEVKALGLSDEEAAFLGRAASFLRTLQPRRGISNLYTPFGSHQLRLNREQRRHAARQAEATARNLPDRVRDLSASVAIGHGAERFYLTRLCERVAEATSQLPGDLPCYVAVHWSNGAPISTIEEALSTVDHPPNLEGAMFFGSFNLYIDQQIHNFLITRFAPFTPGGEMLVRSKVDDELGRATYQVLEQHSGLRACVLRCRWRREWHEILVRDGSRRILPFGIIFGPDPPTADLEPH